jgi:TonB family protein
VFLADWAVPGCLFCVCGDGAQIELSLAGKVMNQLQGNLLFCSLPVPRSRLGCFATSFATQTTALVLLSILTLTVPKVPKHIQYVELVTPSTPKPVRRPLPDKQVPIVVKQTPRIQARLEAPAPPQLIIPPPALPKREVMVKGPVMAGPLPGFEKVNTPMAQPRSERPVQTNVFTASSEPATLPKMAASKVQTGGFGDPNGVPANPGAKGRGNIAALGSFDLPSGPGYGNGTGGARGRAGVVASTDFGNDVPAAPRPAPPNKVQAVKFDLAPPVEAKKAPRQVQQAMLPVAIQEKPTPEYTSEARQLRVEGEVLLQVMFTANGQVRVLRVLRGLGHGLDEAAARAAEKIRFSPAQRDGQPVDSTATLHVVFQLS